MKKRKKFLQRFQKERRILNLEKSESHMKQKTEFQTWQKPILNQNLNLKEFKKKCSNLFEKSRSGNSSSKGKTNRQTKKENWFLEIRQQSILMINMKVQELVIFRSQKTWELDLDHINLDYVSIAVTALKKIYWNNMCGVRCQFIYNKLDWGGIELSK